MVKIRHEGVDDIDAATLWQPSVTNTESASVIDSAS